MSTFRRRGHYRRGPNGQRIWVSGHTVTRSSSRRDTYHYRPPKSAPRPRVATRPQVSATKFPRPRSSRWAKPNARCPVCGAAVYFYSNEQGGRVFFDEIGPPWPKHPCTDNSYLARTARSQDHRRITPVPHSAAKGRRKSAAENRRESKRPAPRSSSPTRAFTVRQAEVREGATVLYLQPIFETSGPSVWRTPANVLPENGQLLFIDEFGSSYFDVRKMQVVRFPGHIDAHASFMSQFEADQSSQDVSQTDGTAGCGGCLLIISVPMLLWLMISIWNPMYHSQGGISAAAWLFMISLGGLIWGVRLIKRSHSRRQDR